MNCHYIFLINGQVFSISDSLIECYCSIGFIIMEMGDKIRLSADNIDSYKEIESEVKESCQWFKRINHYNLNIQTLIKQKTPTLLRARA